MSQGKILLVDDDEFFRNLYSEILISGGFDVVVTNSGKKALEHIHSNQVDLVVTDLVMPDMDGQEVLEGVKQYNAMIDVIVITGHGTIESAITALKSGATDYIRKPVNNDELLLSVNRCIEQKNLFEENQELKKSLKLLKVGRTISSCIDIDRIYDHMLDAIIQEVPADAGICLFYDINKEDEDLHVEASRNMDADTADLFRELFQKWSSENEEICNEISSHNLDEIRGKDSSFLGAMNSFLPIAVKGEDGVKGFLVTFCAADKDIYNKDQCLEYAGYISEQSSISFENIEKYTTARKMVYVDSLTGLYNSKFLCKTLEREVNRSKRTKGPFSVLFLDIDHFKKVNDLHGHLVGSDVLVEVGQILIECVRGIDTVVRYGGDEFTIVLVDTGEDASLVVAERIRKTVEDRSFLENIGLELKTTVSIGISTFPVHAKDEKSILDIADQAMYAGKNKSRNTVYVAPVECN